MYARWSLHAYACTNPYTHIDQHTHTQETTQREELNNTLLLNTKPYHSPLPIPIMINGKDLSEVIALYWSKLLFFSSDVGVEMRTTDCSKVEQSTAPIDRSKSIFMKN